MRIERRPLGLLTREAVGDAARRRIVSAVVILSFLSLLLVNSCTSCSANVVVGGRPAAFDVTKWASVVSFSVLGLWSVALAGLLAADHLRSIFEDGSAMLLLSRPVSRPTLALARLVGSLCVSLGAALVLCLGAAFFIVSREAMPLGPALVATGAVLVGCTTLAALAMTGSLFLPRIVTVLVVLGGVVWIAVANLGAATGVELSGVSYLLDRVGPPVLTTILLALSSWSDLSPDTGLIVVVTLRALAWLIGSVGLLLVVFDQRDLTKLEPR